MIRLIFPPLNISFIFPITCLLKRPDKGRISSTEEEQVAMNSFGSMWLQVCSDNLTIYLSVYLRDSISSWNGSQDPSHDANPDPRGASDFPWDQEGLLTRRSTLADCRRGAPPPRPGWLRNHPSSSYVPDASLLPRIPPVPSYFISEVKRHIWFPCSPDQRGCWSATLYWLNVIKRFIL